MRTSIRGLGLLAMCCLLYAGPASATWYRLVFFEVPNSSLGLRYECIGLNCRGGGEDKIWVPSDKIEVLDVIGPTNAPVGATFAASQETARFTFNTDLSVANIAVGKYNFRESATDLTVKDTLQIDALAQDGFTQVMVTFVTDIGGGGGVGLNPLLGGLDLIEGGAPFYPTPAHGPDGRFPDDANMVHLTGSNITGSGIHYVAFRTLPEPTTLSLFAGTIAGLCLLRRRRRRT